MILLSVEIIKNKAIVFSFQANIYSIILCKVLRTKIIIRSNSSPSGWNKNFFKNYIFSFFLKRSDQIIVNSLSFKKELDKKFSTKSTVIYNPLNKYEIIEKSKKKINYNFFKKDTLNLINIARFTDQKDHFLLLNAVNKLKDILNIRLLIMGYGVNKSKIEKFIKLNRLNKIIHLINFQNNPYPYLRKSNLSNDTIGIEPVLIDMVNHLKHSENYQPDAVILLMPTSPFRKKSTLIKACNVFIKKKLDSLFSVENIKHTHHPNYVFHDKKEFLKSKLKNLNNKKNRQAIKSMFALDGGVIYITKSKIVKKSIIAGVIDYIKISQPESFDIDTIEDLKLCEMINIKL